MIFAYSARLTLVDHICVALMILQRKQLLAGDCLSIYSVLFNYPIDSVSVDLVVNIALASCVWFESPLICPKETMVGCEGLLTGRRASRRLRRRGRRW